MKSVIIRGPLLSLSGYGTHSRQICKWLFKKNNIKISTQLLPWGMTPWLINPEFELGMIGEIMKASTSPNFPNQYDVSFQIQLPNEWDPKIAKYNIGVSAFVETDKCNPAWIESCNKMQHIVVPSHFVKQTIERTGKVNVPISVIPESFYDCILNDSLSSTVDLNLSTSFNFLIFGQVTGNNPFNDRKNTYFMIKWLCEQFCDDKDVGIIIKTNHGTNSTIDKKLTENMILKLLKEVRKGEYPKFYILHGQLNQEEIASVYQNPKIKALVAATRGEGFGLPLLEAAASGLPVIATNWSGHLDFMKLGKFIKLNYELKPIHETKIDNQIFIKGTHWAEPKESDFKLKLKKFRKSSYIPKQWAKELSLKLKKEFSQQAVENKYEDIFKEIIE